MIYSSWDKECDKLKLVITGHFLPFYTHTPPPLTTPNKPKNQSFGKWKKLLEISPFYTCVPKTTIIQGKVPEIRSETDRIFCHFGPPFCSFTHLTNQKIKILQKIKKVPEMSSFYTGGTKILLIWCMLPEVWSVTDIFFCHFGPFLALFHHYWPQKLKFEKNVQKTWRYYPFTHV